MIISNLNYLEDFAELHGVLGSGSSYKFNLGKTKATIKKVKAAAVKAAAKAPKDGKSNYVFISVSGRSKGSKTSFSVTTSSKSTFSSNDFDDWDEDW